MVMGTKKQRSECTSISQRSFPPWCCSCGGGVRDNFIHASCTQSRLFRLCYAKQTTMPLRAESTSLSSRVETNVQPHLHSPPRRAHHPWTMPDRKSTRLKSN